MINNQPHTPTGLSSAEAKERLNDYGPNTIYHKKHYSAVVGFLLKFKNPLIFVLLFAASVSAFLGEWISASLIFAMILFSTALDFFNTYKSQKAAELLKEKVKITATVMRDGEVREIPLNFVVPGDVVLLSAGDIVPADGKIISARDFFLDESSLTGESFPTEKGADDEIFMGSSVVTGSATAVISLTGKSTKFSKIAEVLIRREEPTDFDNGIKDFSFLILKTIFILVIFVFLINALFKHSVLESFLFATALAVGLTPELLPMIITLNLSRGSLAMSKKGVIVKRLSSIQNFGSMDVFCTDKTGTLTEGTIVLVKYVDALGKDSEEVLHNAYINTMFHSGIKNPLDSAIRNFRTIDVSAYKKIDEIPFDYARKRDSVVVERGRKRVLISKGAPEEVFKVCKFYENEQRLFDQDIKRHAQTTYDNLSGDGFRVLALAVKEIKEIKDVYSKDEEEEMFFLGFVAFFDPPKKDVSETLKLMRDYGVEIKIITGDNELVTKKIASEINLRVGGVLRGEEIEEMDDEALRLNVEKTTIFARMSPDQKLRIINILRSIGHVVGYLGDGINDAPALKAADVGVSVENAVDVSKETADLILLKKSLKDLVDGIIEGRKTFSNTIKYLMMNLSSNFGNMFSMAGASIFLKFLPMLPTQILFNNFLYDVSQFGVPLDNVDKDEIKKPRKWRIGFIKKFMMIFGPVSSLFDLITFVVLFFVFKFTNSSFQTGWFLESLATQTLVVHIIRTRSLPFLRSIGSKYLLGSTFLIVFIGWLIPYTPLGRLLSFSPLPPLALLAIVIIVIAYLITVELVKRWFYRAMKD